MPLNTYILLDVVFNKTRFPFTYITSTQSSSPSSSLSPDLSWFSNQLFLHSTNLPSVLGPYSTFQSSTTRVYSHHYFTIPNSFSWVSTCYFFRSLTFLSSFCFWYSIWYFTFIGFIFAYLFICSCTWFTLFSFLIYQSSSYANQVQEWHL